MLFCSFLIIASIIATNKVRLWQIGSRWCQNWLQDAPVELESHNTSHTSPTICRIYLINILQRQRITGGWRGPFGKAAIKAQEYDIESVHIFYKVSWKCPDDLKSVWMIEWSWQCLEDIESVRTLDDPKYKLRTYIFAEEISKIYCRKAYHVVLFVVFYNKLCIEDAANVVFAHFCRKFDIQLCALYLEILCR